MEKEYFFGKNNQQTGPFNEESVKELISSGKITAKTLAWCQGMGGWKEANQVPELNQWFQNLSMDKPAPPPLPQNSDTAITPPPFSDPQTQQNLSSLEQKAYRFVMTIFPRWKGRSSPIRSYVEKCPQKAVPVAVGTMAFLFLLFMLLASNFSKNQEHVNIPSSQQQQAMPPAGWQAQHKAWQDAHSYTQDILDDSYKYRRKIEEKMDDTYRHATYDLPTDSY